MKRLILLLCAAVAAGPVPASDTAPVHDSDRLEYTADWYRSLAPRNALDMVRQTPGFTLEEGDQRRGLAGAMGNVLVDGRRPVAKDQKLEEVLQRIPAGQVLRIDLLRGAAAAGDASGHAVLLNVVRTPFTSQGFGAAGFEYANQDEPMPNGTLVWTGRAHSVDYALGATTYSFARELPGQRALTDVAGDDTGMRVDVSPRDYGQYSLNGEAGLDAGGGRLRVTGKGSYSRYHEDSAVLSYDVNDALTGTDLNPYTENKRGGELGVHFVRQVAGWELDTLLLATRNRFESGITSTHTDPAGAVNSIFTRNELQDSGESILRATLGRALGAGQPLEFGLELAQNTLDAQFALSLDLGEGPFDIPVPNTNVLIEERRADVFVSHGRRFDERWSLGWRLAGEYSRMEFSGDTNQVVTFAFLKPSLEMTRQFGQSNQLRLRVYRDVGQLDFTDFVSSVSLTDERVEGGNPDLRPQTEWSAEVSADLRPGNDIAVSLTGFHRWVRDTADYLPVGPPNALVDAPGNIGDARIYGLRSALRLPLPGLRGAVLSGDVAWQQSEVTDPLTGGSRPISDFQELVLSAGFRQDLPRFTWGVNYASQAETSSWLLREIDRRRVSPSLDAFVEMPLARGLRLRAAILSLLGQAETRDRLYFDPDRRATQYSAERSQRDPGRWLQLGLSGSF
jgi:hypothetical protein